MNQVQMAAQLYSIRDSVRGLMGDNYQPRMAELGGLLQRIAVKQGCSELVVARKIAACEDVKSFDAMAILAAAVELIEPSANDQVQP
jgi:hypothetical protein